MKKLLRYLKNYLKETIIGPFFKLLEASFELIIPLVVAQIIDIGIKDGDIGYIATRALIMIGLGLVGLASSLTAQYFAAKAATGFATELRHSLFEHIQTLSFSEIDEIGTARLINRMTSDVNAVQSCVNMVIRLFLRSPFIVFGAMIMAFTIDVKCALIFCVAIPVLAVIVFGIMLASIPLYRKVQSGLDNILKITRENLTGTRVIRAFNREDDEIESFNRGNTSLRGVQLFAGKISALMNPVTFVVINVATVILLYTGAVKVDTGILTQGQVVALVNYMSQILVELIKLANLIIQVTKAVACANRIQEVFEIKAGMEFPEVSAGSRDDGYAVEFNNVSIAYRNAGAESLSNVDIKVKHGETIGIIGGTGSGKSTLLNIIGGIDGADSGSITIEGEQIEDMTEKKLSLYRRIHLGYIFQMYNLIPNLTVRENIEVGAYLSDKPLDVNELLHTLGLYEHQRKLPNQLSGGQQQRTAIGRAIVKNPDILLCDEPTGALDYNTSKDILRLIETVNQKYGNTVVMVTHNDAIKDMADRVIKLRDGMIRKNYTNEQKIPAMELEW